VFNQKNSITRKDLKSRLDSFSRLSLADLPTPLFDCPRLSKELDGPRILIKREDQTGIAFGGNKIREFEYSLAPAVEGNYDILLHGAASQSNQSRVTAAVAARLGKKAVMVGQRDDHSEPITGNLLLSHIFGADIYLTDNPGEKIEIINRLRKEGHRVYNTSTDGYLLRSIAYVDGFLELSKQLQDQDIHPAALYVCSGVHTHVGLVIGARALGIPVEVIGIKPMPRENEESSRELACVAKKVALMLDLSLQINPADFECHGNYAGEAYGTVTERGRDAVLLMARTEGLLLDPVYTGKAFGAMIEHIRQKRWTKDQTVVFVHTGGTPALFAYGDEILSPKTEVNCD
tara:strand:- start:293 stop:1330 length:1038 start_codon:yes stop_codon:yes gene_type:complete